MYMDNYYTSPELFTELDMQNTYACGTVRNNRKNVPKAFSVVKLKQSESIFRRNGNMLALKFRDKRDIHMLTTIHEATHSRTNRVDRRTNTAVVKPTAIVNYCQKMGGVDVSDQMATYYDVLRKCVKWGRSYSCTFSSFFLLMHTSCTKSMAPT